MEPLSRSKGNAPVTPQGETEQTSKTSKPQQGIGSSSDSFESSKLDSFRGAYLAGRSEGKVIMSDAAFNRVLQSDLTPKQYPEAFKDFKGFVRSNFALSPDQNVTLNRLPENEVRKFQDVGALAAKLNKPIQYESRDLDPSASGPRDMKFHEPMIQENAINLVAECQRPAIAINANNIGQ